MTWKKIIEDDITYISKIHEIARLFEKRIKIENDYLFSGKLGVSLFCLYYGRQFNDNKFTNIGLKYIEKSFKAINSEISNYSLSNGLCGFYWMLKDLEEEGLVDKGIFDEWNIIEQSMVSRLNYYINYKNWDFLHGVMGILWSFCKYNPEFLRKISSSMLCKLELQGDNFDDGSIAWRADKMDRYDIKSEIHSLGLAHGVPGFILILSNFVKQNIEIDYSKKLLYKSFQFLNNHKLDFEKYGYYFPQYIDLPEGTYSERNRLAWCYGDLGLGYALYKAGVNVSDLEMKKLGLRLLANCCTKRSYEETFTIDAGFCHGTVGNAHIFNRIYQDTNIIDFKLSAQYWYEKTLQYSTYKDGLAGYKSFSGEKWVKNYGFLDGVVGIGLSLIAAISEHEPKWDNCLLLS